MPRTDQRKTTLKNKNQAEKKTVVLYLFIYENWITSVLIQKKKSNYGANESKYVSQCLSDLLSFPSLVSTDFPF